MNRRGLALLLLACGVSFVVGGAFGALFYRQRGPVYLAARRIAMDHGWVSKWNSVANPPGPSPQFQAIASIPYVKGSIDPNIGARGVLLWDHRRSQPGVNFYSCNDGH